MGQYYKPTLKPKCGRVWKCFNPWDFNNGVKLMEHSYIGNAVTNYVKNLILRTPMRLVWAGDYADDEKGKDKNLYFLFEAKEPKDKSVPQESIESMRYLVNHKNIQEIGLEISKMKVYQKENDTKEFRACLESIKLYSEGYLHFMGANLHNVL